MVERDGNQRLKLVVLDCLKIFREIMRHPEWMDQFDLTSNCPPPPPSLSLNFDGESTLRWFAPVAAAVPGRRSSRWPCAPTRRGARMAPAALLDWLAAIPLPPPSPSLPPPGLVTTLYRAVARAGGPARRPSSRWPGAPTRRGAPVPPAALLDSDWLAATPLSPLPPPCRYAVPGSRSARQPSAEPVRPRSWPRFV